MSHLVAALLGVAFVLAQDPPAKPAGVTPAIVQGSQPARVQGLSLVVEPLDLAERAKQGVHAVRAHLLSLAVERGESPSPMLSMGMFTATFRTVLPLPVRDRYRFQIHGKGSVKLTINGESVLSGSLRPGKPLETAEPVRLKKGDNELVCTIESNLQGEAQLRVFWSGTMFSWEPIAPTAMEWALDDDAIAKGERLRLGHQLFVERKCAQCHQTDRPLAESAFGELAAKGPDLRNAGARLTQAWLAEWLKNPRAVRPEATMPRMSFESASDPADLAAFLAKLGAPLPGEAFSPDAAGHGAARFRELGCIACHVPPEQARDEIAGGHRIALGFVAAKWQPNALVQYLLDPQRDFPDVRMPHFQLEADDANGLAAYLTKNYQPANALPGDAERGRKLAVQWSCARCHTLDLPESGERFQALQGLNVDRGCLAQTLPKKAPDFDFSEQQRTALRGFLPSAEAACSQRAPIDYAARMVQALRCTSCHGRNGEPSVWSRLASAASEEEPLPCEQDPNAQGLPVLTWVGSKLQPSWMERFVSGREKSPRPWLNARMPSFGRRGENVVQGLVREHGYPSQDEPEQNPDNQLATHGQRLVKMGEGLGCVQCHGIGAQKAIQVFERAGINFAVASKRLRKDYFLRWMMDPPRLDPDAKMPKYAGANGKTAISEVLDGDARKQFEAIWHYFRSQN